MSGFRPFVRQLGFQPGIQLNPLADNTDGAAPDNSDQVLAMVGRFTRGRIDRPFRVNRSNLYAKTGKADTMRASLLNEAKLQLRDALFNGAQEAVVYRLNTSAATKKWALINVANGATTYAVGGTDLTDATYSIALLHHDCHNDGIKVAVHAEPLLVGGIPVLNPTLTIRVLDSEGNRLHEFTGSVNPDAKDDYGASAYLPDVAANLTEAVSLVVNAAFTGVPTTSNAYGRGADGRDQWPTSALLACFVEGSTTYLAGDYDRAVDALRNTTDPFGYIISGGTQVLSLLAKLADFAIEANIPMKLDYSGNLDPEAVLTLDAALGLDTHYVHKYWAPLEAEDPASGGRAVWGASGLLTGYSCRRNARVNANGFAPKNYPVAGKEWPIVRTSTRQLHKPTEQQLSDLAKAQINPVIFDLYNGGGRFVATDCLTAAKTRVSYKKLIPVAEMSASLDNWVSMYAKEILLQPMSVYIKSMKTFLQNMLEGAEASGWLKPSKNLDGNAAFAYSVVPDEVRSADVVHIYYWTSFDGVARQGYITQTLTR